VPPGARERGAAAALAVGPGCEGVGAPARVNLPVDGAGGEIAFDLAGPGGAALVVPVHINGRGPYDLILDTGATFTCVDESLARELALPEQRGAVGAGVGIGGAGRVRLLRADSLRVGAATAERITVCALDLQALRAARLTARGLLGLNFLKPFRVTLDFERRTLRLEKGGAAGASGVAREAR
jgi:predicted aspartyl protease